MLTMMCQAPEDYEVKLFPCKYLIDQHHDISPVFCFLDVILHAFI